MNCAICNYPLVINKIEWSNYKIGKSGAYVICDQCYRILLKTNAIQLIRGERGDAL